MQTRILKAYINYCDAEGIEPTYEGLHIFSRAIKEYIKVCKVVF